MSKFVFFPSLLPLLVFFPSLLLLLALVTLACIIGPWIVPHDYRTVYRNYVKVPASIEAHPKADEVEKTVASALKRARVTVESTDVSGGVVRRRTVRPGPRSAPEGGGSTPKRCVC